jgi:hypothetical protein
MHGLLLLVEVADSMRTPDRGQSKWLQHWWPYLAAVENADALGTAESSKNDQAILNQDLCGLAHEAAITVHNGEYHAVAPVERQMRLKSPKQPPYWSDELSVPIPKTPC